MIQYHRCPGCASIFTDQDISEYVVTENDAVSHRNTPARFETVLMRTRARDEQEFPGFLDYGCGTGAFVEYLNRTGLPTIGIDTDTKIQLSKCDNEIFSGAFMIESIEHLSNPIEIVNEVLTKIKPKGFLYIESTFADSIEDHTTHRYVDPKIGHRTILSRQALSAIEGVTQEWVNSHVLIMRKK